MSHRMLPASAVPEVLKCVHTALMRALALYEDGPDVRWRGKRGGVFCLADDKGVPLLTALIGEVEQGTVPSYTSYCHEKAARLGRHLDHDSSWESRNPKKNQRGGAVLIGGSIWSFSGLPEFGDEVVMLGAACQHWHSQSPGHVIPRAIDIASRTHNPYWEGLRSALGL
jgi:hypothetical protein